MPTLKQTFISAALVFATPWTVQADNLRFWTDVTDYGGPLLWVAGLGSSLVQDGSFGPDHAARTFDGFLATLALTEALKETVRERRPDAHTLDSFPSLHTSLSFEVAAAQSNYHPHQAVFWYAAAGLVGLSRQETSDHFMQDIIAGGLLGYGLGQLSVSSKHGWFVAPIFERGRAGLSLSFTR